MKFSFKIFIITIVFLVASFSAGCSTFIRLAFDSVLEQEMNKSIDDSQMIRFSFETAAANVPTKYEQLKDETISEIFGGIENSVLYSGIYIQVTDYNHNILYNGSAGMEFNQEMYTHAGDNQLAYGVVKIFGDYYIQTVTKFNVSERVLHLETLRNINSAFSQRQNNFRIFQWLTILLVFLSSIVMLFVARWLSRPVEGLSHAAKAIAGGRLDARVATVTDADAADELGQLAMDFNKMADSLEEKVKLLQEEATRREVFIADFSHELKTPLTSIIGYADMLRSRPMDQEQQFIATNYIFNEGKRLETLSHKLMELIGIKKVTLEKKKVSIDLLFQSIQMVFAPIFAENELHLHVEYEEGWIMAEPDLLKSLFINLIDNARKASEKGGKVEFFGSKEGSGYHFLVRDYGFGISKEDLGKVTEAFYMADKARTRSQNGFGLGLSLCAEIAAYHGTELKIESQVGKGTAVHLRIKEEDYEA